MEWRQKVWVRWRHVLGGDAITRARSWPGHLNLIPCRIRSTPGLSKGKCRMNFMFRKIIPGALWSGWRLAMRRPDGRTQLVRMAAEEARRMFQVRAPLLPPFWKLALHKTAMVSVGPNTGTRSASRFNLSILSCKALEKPLSFLELTPSVGTQVK